MGLRIMPLEERIVLDAAGVAQLDDPVSSYDNGITDSDHDVKVLLISSDIDNAQTMAAAAVEDVLTCIYDADKDTLYALLSDLKEMLGSDKANSIAFATHSSGEAGLDLTGDYFVNLDSLLSDPEIQNFWQDVGSLVEDEGRIDLFACDLAATTAGKILIDQLEALTERNVAASDDRTGNAANGGDWVLETDNTSLVSEYFFKDKLADYSGVLGTTVKIAPPAAVTSSAHFGNSVSISGDYAIAGAEGDDYNSTNFGSAYIFERGGDGTWTQQPLLTPGADGASGDKFGESVSIDGDYAIVGAFDDDDDGTSSGSAYIFKRENDGTWLKQAKITANDGAAGDVFGTSVSIDGDYAVVGAWQDDDGGSKSGSAYIFKRSGTNWTEQAKITASDAATNDYFGYAVSIHDDYVVVGAHADDDDSGKNAGAAYIFKKDVNAETWTQQAKLVAEDRPGADHLGISVSISGAYAICGANGDDDDGTNSGSAYIFKKDDGAETWTQQAKVTAEDGAAGDIFGISVSIDGDYAAVGAYEEDGNAINDSGSTYVFQRNGANWTQYVKLTANDAGDSDKFGKSVSISGDFVVTGAYYNDDNGANSGSIYLYSNDPPTASNKTVSTDKDISYTFEGTDFNFTDTDSNDSLSKIKITQLEAAGALTLDGVDVTLNQEIIAADITSGKLIFSPGSGESGADYSNFKFMVNDGTLNSTLSYDMTIDVNFEEPEPEPEPEPVFTPPPSSPSPTPTPPPQPVLGSSAPPTDTGDTTQGSAEQAVELAEELSEELTEELAEELSEELSEEQLEKLLKEKLGEVQYVKAVKGLAEAGTSSKPSINTVTSSHPVKAGSIKINISKEISDIWNMPIKYDYVYFNSISKPGKTILENKFSKLLEIRRGFGANVSRHFEDFKSGKIDIVEFTEYLTSIEALSKTNLSNNALAGSTSLAAPLDGIDNTMKIADRLIVEMAETMIDSYIKILFPEDVALQNEIKESTKEFFKKSKTITSSDISNARIHGKAALTSFNSFVERHSKDPRVAGILQIWKNELIKSGIEVN